MALWAGGRAGTQADGAGLRWSVCGVRFEERRSGLYAAVIRATRGEIPAPRMLSDQISSSAVLMTSRQHPQQQVIVSRTRK